MIRILKKRLLKPQSDLFSSLKSTPWLKSTVVSLYMYAEKSDGIYRVVQFRIPSHRFETLDRMQRCLNYSFKGTYVVKRDPAAHSLLGLFFAFYHSWLRQRFTRWKRSFLDVRKQLTFIENYWLTSFSIAVGTLIRRRAASDKLWECVTSLKCKMCGSEKEILSGTPHPAHPSPRQHSHLLQFIIIIFFWKYVLGSFFLFFFLYFYKKN